MNNNGYEQLLLSADGAISLYRVTPAILADLDRLAEAFYEWKNTDSYDETLFVSYLQNRFGPDCICFVKVVGQVGGRINNRTGRVETAIAEEYRSCRWYNF